MTALTAARRAELEELPVPVEGGFAVQACVVGLAAGVDGEHRLAWMHDGGRHKVPFGPAYASARAACAASLLLNERSFGPAS